jgi:hypothetical protein
MLKPSAIVLAAIALGACQQLENQERAERAQTELVGLTRAQLIDCAGQPDRVVSGGSFEQLVYLYGEHRRMVGEPDPQSTGIQTAPPTANSTPWCEATFFVENSRVTNVRYRGQTGGIFTGQHNVCGEIVYHCVRVAPRTGT